MFIYVHINIKMVTLFLWGIGTEKEQGRWLTFTLYIFAYNVPVLISFLEKKKIDELLFWKKSQNYKSWKYSENNFLKKSWTIWE